MRLTTNIPVILLALAACAPSDAQVFRFTREQMIKYTADNPFDRFEDGRPKAPDALLEKCKDLSAEEVWAVLPGAKFPNQYEGNWQIVHPEKKLVGRAVTAQFMPYRPDVGNVAEKDARDRGLGANNNQRVIDSLQPGDVLVVDLFGKIEGGTFVGDNLATAIYAATKGGGLVVDGAVRDLEGIYPIDMAVYIRGVHPTPISRTAVMLTAVNTPVRIGGATVLPGDIVFGDREGVYFIPPSQLKAVLDKADVTHIHDEWTKKKFMTGKYKSSEVYPSPTREDLKKEYEEYLKQKMGK